MARAVRFDEYGPVDVLQVVDVPVPTPDRHDVVVEVVTAGINPGEIAIREGAMAEQYPADFPSGQGSDFAGRVHALGADVTGWKVGDDVLGWSDERSAQADYVRVPSDQLTVRPPDVPWDQAGALPIAGSTAYAAIRAIGAQEGETVAVSAAAGGVGSLTVQLLRARGCRVIGIAGDDSADAVRSLGAEFVAYGDRLGQRLRDAVPDGIDAFVDTFGGGYVQLAVGLGVPPQRVNTIIDFETAERLGTRADGGSSVISAGVLGEIVEQLATGEVVVPIVARYPLEQVREAYTELADRHTHGKIVLDVRPEPGAA